MMTEKDDTIYLIDRIPLLRRLTGPWRTTAEVVLGLGVLWILWRCLPWIMPGAY